jgi:hypothetical protein
MPKELAVKKNTGDYYKITPVKNTDNFRKRASGALLTALNDSKYAQELKAELAPLLFPGEKEVTKNQLEKTISLLICEAGYE